MRVTSVHMPTGIPSRGLKPISMTRLGRVVILAGKNGSGKTRLLNTLADWNSAAPVDTHVRSVAYLHETYRSNSFVSGLKDYWWFNDELWANVIRLFSYEPHNKEISELRKNVFILEFDAKQTPLFVHFVPKQAELKDSSKITTAEILARSESVEKVGVNELNINVLARIQAIQNRWSSATHQQAMAPEEEKQLAIKRYEDLRALVERFLGAKLGRTLDGEVELFGFPAGKSKLSDGQKILLQFCVAIHAQADKLSELIVLMDEPENHLHPGAMIEAIHEIEKALSNGQLWIATHSVPLLAQFDPDTIWWVEDGAVQHAGSQPEKVLSGLVGDSEGLARIHDFLGLPASLAANNFAHQCLLPPAVVTNGSEDPQNQQIQKILERYRLGESIRIIDFGAGQGRLISAIRENSATGIEQAKQRIDYIAYDKSADFSDECTAAIARLYEKSDGRYFNDERDIRARIGKGSADVVVMCNALHEIDPSQWISLFSAQGLIRFLLKSQGFLLIVEDMEMRIGEKAHQKGFLVLDTADIRTLFKIPESESRFVVDDARGDGRLKAHLIPVSHLGNVTNDSLKEALTQVKHLAKEEIKKLRLREPNYKEGRRHAFYVQQFANAELALEPMGN